MAASDREGSGSSLPLEEMILNIKWAGKDYCVRAAGNDTVSELKRRICELTGVLPKRQKLLNLKMGSKAASDEIFLSQLTLKANSKIMMMGSVEDDIIVDPVETPEVEDDFQVGEEETVEIKDREENQQKVRRRSAQLKMKLLEPPRPGKKLLVLDVDYTIFDHNSTAEKATELMRPYLHEFLTQCYIHYDLIIWSATSMRWVELKMRDLGLLTHEAFKLTALIDHMGMVTVHSSSHGVFDCKPLQVIWDKFPEFYNPKNTIMFDDLRRNFVMNPQNGLIIRPFRKAHLYRDKDCELVHLAKYLLLIARLEDFTPLDHQNWESYVRKFANRGEGHS